MATTQTEKLTKFTLLSIDAWAWREPEGGWTWNNSYRIEDMLLTDNQQTPRKIFKLLRDMNYLNDNSIGTVALEDDQHNLVIVDKNTRKPIFALDYGSNWEYNEK